MTCAWSCESVMFSFFTRLTSLRCSGRERAAPSGIRERVIRAATVLALLLPGLSLCVNAAESYAPAKNWVLPLFTKEGFRQMTARGTEARLVTAHEFEVIDLNLTVFSGDAAMRVDTILLSPAATFLPDTKTAHGDKSVRFIGEDIEASGTRWLYRHQAKKISLDGDVRVTFSAELKNLLQ